jgi:hypothetical protein
MGLTYTSSVLHYPAIRILSGTENGVELLKRTKKVTLDSRSLVQCLLFPCQGEVRVPFHPLECSLLSLSVQNFIIAETEEEIARKLTLFIQLKKKM